MKYYYWIFVALVALIVAVALAWTLGWYPVASVDGSFIYEREVSHTAHYLKNISDEITRFAEDQQQEPRQLTEGQARTLALEDLIEQRVIRSILLERMERQTLDQLIEAELGALRGNPRLHEATRSLYGGTFPAIERYILAPQAERDILASRLLLEGVDDFQGWLEERKSQTEIRRF